MDRSAEIEARYAPELRRFCRRMVYSEALSEEIVQDVLARACRPDAGNPGGGHPLDSDVFRDGKRLRGWLYRVARNRCIDVLRKMRPEVRLSAIQAGRTPSGQPAMVDPLTTPATRAVKTERVEQAQAALDALDDDLRSVIIMRVYQGLSRQEIADALGLSVSGVKARMARAFNRLKEQLASLDHSSG